MVDDRPLNPLGYLVCIRRIEACALASLRCADSCTTYAPVMGDAGGASSSCCGSSERGESLVAAASGALVDDVTSASWPFGSLASRCIVTVRTSFGSSNVVEDGAVTRRDGGAAGRAMEERGGVVSDPGGGELGSTSQPWAAKGSWMTLLATCGVLAGSVTFGVLFAMTSSSAPDGAASA